MCRDKQFGQLYFTQVHIVFWDTFTWYYGHWSKCRAKACIDVFCVCTCVHPNVRHADMRQDSCRCDVRFVSKYSNINGFFQHILQHTNLSTQVRFPTHDPVLKQKRQLLWEPNRCSKSWSTKIFTPIYCHRIKLFQCRSETIRQPSEACQKTSTNLLWPC